MRPQLSQTALGPGTLCALSLFPAALVKRNVEAKLGGTWAIQQGRTCSAWCAANGGTGAPRGMARCVAAVVGRPRPSNGAAGAGE